MVNQSFIVPPMRLFLENRGVDESILVRTRQLRFLLAYAEEHDEVDRNLALMTQGGDIPTEESEAVARVCRAY